MRGPALLAALSMVLTAVPAALAVETAGRDPARSHGGPLFGCAGGGVVRPFAADLKQDGAVSGYEDGAPSGRTTPLRWGRPW